VDGVPRAVGGSSVWDAFDGRPHRLRMGLRPLDPHTWTVPPPAGLLGAELDRKARLLAEQPGRVSLATAGCEPAASELLADLLRHLTVDHPDRYRAESPGAVIVDGTRRVPLGDRSPLEVAGLLVAGDWCLIRPGRPPVLAAGVVCSPNRWSLAAKVGLPIGEVHAPVPGYAGALGAPVDRLLGPGGGRPVWRQNWSLLGDPSPFQPEPASGGSIDVPDGVWVRSERQTLVALERTGWGVFGIETSQEPLGTLAGRPDLARRVLAAVAGLDPATASYKELAGWRARLIAWLEAASGPPPSGQAPQDQE
jgi:hypothetical protein